MARGRGSRGEGSRSSSQATVAETVFPPVWAARFGLDRLSPFPFADAELADDVFMRFRCVPSGSFLMGSPEDEHGRLGGREALHEVRLTRGLWLAETPCTRRQWSVVMGIDLDDPENEGELPIAEVSWEDCAKFFDAVRKVSGLHLRLPTDAEWEYACRAGTQSAFNDGSACTQPTGRDPALDELGWYYENSDYTSHPVKQKRPNAWGLFDMHGNVWEWCRDWWTADLGTEPGVDPDGPETGQVRVIRGGCFGNDAGSCRSACRGFGDPGGRDAVLGFRAAAGQGEPGDESVPEER